MRLAILQQCLRSTEHGVRPAKNLVSAVVEAGFCRFLVLVFGK